MVLVMVSCCHICWDCRSVSLASHSSRIYHSDDKTNRPTDFSRCPVGLPAQPVQSDLSSERIAISSGAKNRIAR